MPGGKGVPCASYRLGGVRAPRAEGGRCANTPCAVSRPGFRGLAAAGRLWFLAALGGNSCPSAGQGAVSDWRGPGVSAWARGPAGPGAGRAERGKRPCNVSGSVGSGDGYDARGRARPVPHGPEVAGSGAAVTGLGGSIRVPLGLWASGTSGLPAGGRGDTAFQPRGPRGPEAAAARRQAGAVWIVR